MAVPLPAANLAAWQSWTDEITGPRKSDFDGMNKRHGATEHQAYLQTNPDGSHLVIVIIEGPGSESLMANIAASDHEFDKWFLSKVGEVHGVDPSGPLPSLAERRI